MQHPNFRRPAAARRLALCACALAAIAAMTAVHAHPRTRLKTSALTISGTPSTSDVAGTAYSFTPTASGPSGYTLTFSISGKPSWASFNTANGQLAGTPATTDVGTFSNITITVSDGPASSSLAPFSITVSAPPAPNSAPTISGTPGTADTVGTPYTFTPQASDTDGDALSFSVQNLPSWATFSIATGALSGTPTTAGTYSNIVISVSDGYTSVSLAPFSINVTQPATSGSATLTWTAPVTNTDGSALTDLAGYHIYYGSSATALSNVIDVASAGTTSYTVASLTSGTWYFAVSAYTTSGLESTLSNTGSKSIP